MSYTPRIPPTNPEDLLTFIDDELLRIAQVLNRLNDGEYTVLYNPPARVFPGLVVYADGTSWNPGAGEGLYRYSLAGAWVKVG